MYEAAIMTAAGISPSEAPPVSKDDLPEDSGRTLPDKTNLRGPTDRFLMRPAGPAISSDRLTAGYHQLSSQTAERSWMRSGRMVRFFTTGLLLMKTLRQ